MSSSGNQAFAAAKAEAAKYWGVIRWNPVVFLTLHDLDASRIYHDRMRPTFWSDVLRVIRATAGGVAKGVEGAVQAVGQRKRTAASARKPYLLLVTAGGAKYASEEKAILDACRNKGIAVRTVRMFFEPESGDDAALSPSALLRPRDHLAALGRWLGRLSVELRRFMTFDRKQQSLFAAAIKGMWQWHLHQAFAKRIVDECGLPRAVLSLLPSAGMSRAIMERMASLGVGTFGIRTQTTSRHLEHLAINSDVLFCKSENEKREYGAVFDGNGPRLEEGCILSLPDAEPAEPLTLPDSYALLLGTAPTTEEQAGDYGRFNAKMFEVARAAGLPVVFKSHDLAKELDRAWFSEHRELTDGVVQVEEVSRNRELIDRAALVVSAPSTLLYYAILKDVPTVIIESRPYLDRDHEFRTSPLALVRWPDAVVGANLGREQLPASARAAKRWFEENYYLAKGPEYILDLMLSTAG